MKAILILLILELKLFADVSSFTSTYVLQGGKMVTVNNTDSISIPDSEEESKEQEPFDTTSLTLTKTGWVIGECDPFNRRPLIYTENFILESDHKSEVAATMRINIGGVTTITCIEVVDRGNSTRSPQILSGGIGANYIKLSVSPGYGKGFDFSVRVFGYYL